MNSSAFIPFNIIPGREHRSYLSRMSLYVGVLFVLFPLLTGLIGPFILGADEKSDSKIFLRLAYLIATGGFSFGLAFLPALLIPGPGFFRRAYEFLLFPMAAISSAAQLIMFVEFGTEINDRVLGLFEGNLPALWSHASDEYFIDWVIGFAILISLGLAYAIGSWRKSFWSPGRKTALGYSFIVGMSAAIAFGMDHRLEDGDPYDASKLSGAPVFQVVTFAGRQLFLEQTTGLEDILERTGGIRHEDERSEIAARLGESPESYVRQEVERPKWLRKQPTHVFLFVMEGKDYAFINNEAIGAVAPRLREFAATGIAVPWFFSSSSATIDAIQAMHSGTSALSRYPDERMLSRLKLDSLPRIAERAGYTPMFYAASHREFGNKGDSCEAFGYEQFVGLPDLLPELASNEWGVHDGPFFDWTLNQLDQVTGPAFVSFLNVSYHAPFDVAEDELGSALDLPPEVADHFYGKSFEERLRYASHAHYADREIGEAVDFLVERYPDALFCFVADHCGGRLRGESSRQIPFILWNDSVIDSSVDVSGWFGSHMDIPATFGHLLLPERESFQTLGSPLWSDEVERVSLAGDWVLSMEGCWDRKGRRIRKFSGHSASSPEAIPESLRLKSSAVASLSWGLMNDKIDFINFDPGMQIASLENPDTSLERN